MIKYLDLIRNEAKIKDDIDSHLHLYYTFRIEILITPRGRHAQR